MATQRALPAASTPSGPPLARTVVLTDDEWFHLQTAQRALAVLRTHGERDPDPVVLWDIFTANAHALVLALEQRGAVSPPPAEWPRLSPETWTSRG